MTLTVKHASLTGAAANPDVLVDGPKWDADHTVTGDLPVAQLAGGSGATASTFWRGDGTWATPASGGTPGGSTTQIQYNNAGTFAGITGATTNGTTVSLTTPTLTTAVASGVWTVSGSWTIPAVTLGGTVSGGGNQLNNVIIGTSTPLAGSFTTVTAPTVTGGSAAGSDLLLNGTSNGAPSSAFVNIQSNGQFTSIGNATPKTYLDLNCNLSSSPALVVATSVTRVQGADSVSGGQEWVSYVSAGGAGNILTGATAGGTAASKTASPNGAYLYNMRGYGWNGSAWAVGALWIMKTTELWSGTAQGSGHDWYTTPTGTTGLTNSMSLWASGGLDIGTGTDPGAGAILASKSVKSKDATAGIGYATGAGGTVTQATNKATGVTLNTACGAITMNNAALAAGTIVSFVLTNSAISAADVLILNHISAGTPGSYSLNARAAAGSATIDVRNNTAGSLGEAIVIQFALIKSVNA